MAGRHYTWNRGTDTLGSATDARSKWVVFVGDLDPESTIIRTVVQIQCQNMLTPTFITYPLLPLVWGLFVGEVAPEDVPGPLDDPTNKGWLWWERLFWGYEAHQIAPSFSTNFAPSNRDGNRDIHSERKGIPEVDQFIYIVSQGQGAVSAAHYLSVGWQQLMLVPDAP